MSLLASRDTAHRVCPLETRLLSSERSLACIGELTTLHTAALPGERVEGVRDQASR